MKIRVKAKKDRSRTGRVGWAATGALVAYTTLGGRTAAPARAQAASGSFAAVHSSVPAQTLHFELPAGALETLVDPFQKATGLTLALPDPAIRGIQCPGVTGDYTVAQALEHLVAGTGIAYRFTGPQSVTLELRLADSVVVTGRSAVSSPKYTEPLRDVPQTITVIPTAIMQEQNATTLRDVLRNVTGISIQAGEGGVPAGDNLSVRGFSARTDLFIDGVRDFGGYARDSYNIEQVEVAKGPASSYTGRGSTGGSINLVWKAPGMVRQERGSIGLGTTAYKRGTIDVNEPLPQIGIKGTAVRLNALWTDTGTPGRDVVENQRWGVAPTVAFGLGTPTRLTLSYSFLDQQNTPDYGIPWFPSMNVPLLAYRDQPAPVEYSNFYGMTDRDYEKTRTSFGTAVAQRDLGRSFTVRNLFRLGTTKRDSLITAPRFESDTSTSIRRTDWKSRDQNDDIVANQTDLTGHFRTGRVEHGVVTGIEFAAEESKNFLRNETAPTLPATDLYHPTPDDTYTGSLVRNGGLTDGDARSWAAYAFDTVKISQSLEVTGGVRWDEFELDYVSRDAAGVETSFGRTDGMLSWRGAVVLKPAPSTSVYAAAGSALNPSAEGLSLSASTADLPPEETYTYEAGTKWEIAGRGTLTAAVFRTEKTNARTPGVDPGDPPTVLEGRYRVDGFEFSFAGTLVRRLDVFGGYTYMDSRILETNTPAEAGRQFANTPRHSFNLWSTYRMRRNVQVGGGVRYVDDRYSSNTNTRKAPAYWLLDAMAGYDISQKVVLRLNLGNLANERYLDRVGGGHVIPGPTRSASLTLDFGL